MCTTPTCAFLNTMRVNAPCYSLQEIRSRQLHMLGARAQHERNEEVDFYKAQIARPLASTVPSRLRTPPAAAVTARGLMLTRNGTPNSPASMNPQGTVGNGKATALPPPPTHLKVETNSGVFEFTASYLVGTG